MVCTGHTHLSIAFAGLILNQIITRAKRLAVSKKAFFIVESEQSSASHCHEPLLWVFFGSEKELILEKGCCHGAQGGNDSWG